MKYLSLIKMVMVFLFFGLQVGLAQEVIMATGEDLREFDRLLEKKKAEHISPDGKSAKALKNPKAEDKKVILKDQGQERHDSQFRGGGGDFRGSVDRDQRLDKSRTRNNQKDQPKSKEK